MQRGRSGDQRRRVRLHASPFAESNAASGLLHALQRRHHQRSIQIRARRAGVGVILGEEFLDLRLAHLLVTIGDGIGEIDERHAFGLGDLRGPLAEIARARAPPCRPVQILRTVSESTIGVAPFALRLGDELAACTSRRCAPFPACRRAVVNSCDSSPMPGSEPRARSLSGALPSLWPNWISTKSPGFNSFCTCVPQAFGDERAAAAARRGRG